MDMLFHYDFVNLFVNFFFITNSFIDICSRDSSFVLDCGWYEMGKESVIQRLQ